MSSSLQIPKTNGINGTNGHIENSSPSCSPQSSPFKNGFSKSKHNSNDLEDL